MGFDADLMRICNGGTKHTPLLTYTPKCEKTRAKPQFFFISPKIEKINYFNRFGHTQLGDLPLIFNVSSTKINMGSLCFETLITTLIKTLVWT